MTRVFKAQEIHIATPNKVGTLAKITAPIAEAGININGFNSYVIKDEAHFYLVTADHTKTKNALEKAGFKTSSKEVIVVETSNETGSLFKAASELAESNVDLYRCYATAGGEGLTWIVFGTDNIPKALNSIS